MVISEKFTQAVEVIGKARFSPRHAKSVTGGMKLLTALRATCTAHAAQLLFDSPSQGVVVLYVEPTRLNVRAIVVCIAANHDTASIQDRRMGERPEYSA